MKKLVVSFILTVVMLVLSVMPAHAAPLTGPWCQNAACFNHYENGADVTPQPPIAAWCQSQSQFHPKHDDVFNDNGVKIGQLWLNMSDSGSGCDSFWGAYTTYTGHTSYSLSMAVGEYDVQETHPQALPNYVNSPGKWANSFMDNDVTGQCFSAWVNGVDENQIHIYHKLIYDALGLGGC